MAVGAVLVALLGLALAVLALYFFYHMVHRAFRNVGFTAGEAGLILLGTFFLAGVDVPVWPWRVGGGWTLAVNLGGALVPVAVSLWLLYRIRSMALPAVVGVVFVAIATYLVTRVDPTGIVVPIYLAGIPPLVAAGLSLTAFWREEDHAAPLAYVSGTFGALIGADVLRLPEFLAQAPPDPGALASIGGGAVFDMVFLCGVVAVGLDALVFRRRQKERSGATLPYEEAEVFTVGTSPERLASWDLPKPPAAMAVHGETVSGRAQSVRDVVREDVRGAPRPSAAYKEAPALTVKRAPATTEDPRLAQHRAWEEQMRRRRGER